MYSSLHNALNVLASKRGFSLVEAAIVLGVVGLVIGGIWVAASAVQENLKIERTLKTVSLVSESARNLFPVWAINQRLPADDTGTYITSEAIKSGIIPGDWIPSGSNQSKHPWGGNFDVYLQRQAGTSMVNLMLSPPLSAASCIRLVMAVGNAYRDNNTLRYIGIAGTPTTLLSTFPVSLSAATTACATSPLTYLAFYFVSRV